MLSFESFKLSGRRTGQRACYWVLEKPLMSSVPKRRYTPDEYLALERRADFKSEYFKGEIFAMAGASRQHVRIATNVIARVDEQLRDTTCEIFGSDMRVRVSPTGLYTYPDASIACGELQFEDDTVDTLLNPKVIFEVLSDGTEAYDRGKKFDHYRQIASLAEYVIVSQREPLVERFTRQPDGAWRMTVLKGLESVLELESIRCRLNLRDIYFKVAFGDEAEAGKL
jgi:Uma2 family endonuclease